MFKKIINKAKEIIAKRSSNSYIEFLRSKGVVIGEGTYIYSKNALIDFSRPSLVSIGKNCYINQHFTLLTHDWVTKVLLGAGYKFQNSSGKVEIGDNVSFGQNVMVLKGVTIGDNCFIGAGSIVTKDIPSGSIAVGTPCKVIMTLEEYHAKRERSIESDAIQFCKSIYERFGRLPRLEEMREEFIYFVDGDKVENYPMLPIKEQLGPMYDSYVLNHKAKYRDFRSFLEAANLPVK